MDYPLSGILKCALCGHTFSSTSKNNKRYYRCTGYGKHTKNSKCPAREKAIVEAELIEEVVREEFSRVVKNFTIYYNSKNYCNEALRSHTAELEICRKERDNLFLTSKNENEKDKHIAICERIRQLRNEIVSIEDSIMDSQDNLFGKEVNDYCLKMEEAIRIVSPKALNAFYKRHIKKIEINPQKKTLFLDIYFAYNGNRSLY